MRSEKPVLRAALLLFICLAGAQTAWADCGEAIAPPVVSVRTLAQPPTQDVSHGIAQLSADRSLAVPRGLENFRFAVGATAAQAQGRTNWQMRGEPLAGGGYCWEIAQLEIVVTVATKVYIAREVPRGSCLWNEVVRHEAKHVRADQKLFPELSGLIRPKVLRAISRTVPAANENDARAALGALINRAVQEAVAAFQVTRNQQQLTIDTAAEYSRANRVCGNAEVAAAIQRAGLK
ncbi:hypothetical protein [Dongia rigui]|uniref:Secreted Zn-dependent protease n=1 Tax=Dongia rigui TaxID=940149 RepID=A0ABU5E0X3_9PROT|nr:hypothetical protein [Dongia rigui]MDY0872869.1 hypothetical protein [Dongia rigui]